MAYKKKATRGVKSPALKAAEKKIEQLNALVEEAHASLHKAQDDARHWERSYRAEYDARMKAANGEGAKAACDAHRNGVLETAIIRAHQELSHVKAVENNPAALQRIIGSVQGGLAVALEQNGNLQGGLIDLYPEDEDARRRLDAIRNTVCSPVRY